MNFDWKDEYEDLAVEFMNKHFGGPQGITSSFPCMRAEYKWGKHRPLVADSRITAKNNTEYHGLEKHASQYHAIAQYDFAYHHWLMAASWRLDDMLTNNFDDSSHKNAITYTIKQALYNRDLDKWQKSPSSINLPSPEDYGLTSLDVDKKESDAWEQLNSANEKSQADRER